MWLTYELLEYGANVTVHIFSYTDISLFFKRLWIVTCIGVICIYAGQSMKNRTPRAFLEVEGGDPI